MKRVIQVGKPIHLKLKGGSTSCGLMGKHDAVYDPRHVTCFRCLRTKEFKKILNGE